MIEDVLAIVLIFGTGGAFLLSISPVGRAVADRIRGGGREKSDESQERVADLLDEIDRVRDDLVDVQERLDFLERVLPRGPGANRLPSGEPKP